MRPDSLERYRKMGHLVTSPGTLPWGELVGSYGQLLLVPLQVMATPSMC
jgi:hypothetical protein